MVNENNLEGVSNNNTKIVIVVSVIFIIIASISVYSFYKINNLSLSNGGDDKTSQVLDNNQAEIDRMNAELDAIKASRPPLTISVEEQEKQLDILRNRALKKQASSMTPEEQEKELDRLKASATANQ